MLFQSYTIHCTHLCKILEKRKKKKKNNALRHLSRDLLRRMCLIETFREIGWGVYLGKLGYFDTLLIRTLIDAHVLRWKTKKDARGGRKR